MPTITLMTKDTKYGMSLEAEPDKDDCRTCLETGSTNQSCSGLLVNNSEDMTKHTDVCGSFHQGTFGETHSFVTFTVTFHRYTQVKRIKKRDEVRTHHHDFINWVERNRNERVNRVQSDNSREFISRERELREKSLGFMTSTAYCPK